MTTRRRRTPSEAGCEETFFATAASILPQSDIQQFNLLPPSSQIPSNFVLNSYPEGDAIYKKTDVQVTSSNSIAVNYTYQENKSSGSNYYSEIRDNTRNNLDNRTDCSNSSNSINPSNFYENDIREKIIDNMASRDRTQEFTRIIRSQQGNLVNGSIKYKEGKRPKDFRQYGEFMQRAKFIGRNISSTYAKLEKLTHLAKKRSLFDDSQDLEIQELTGIIRHDLTSLTKQLEDLQNRSKLTGTFVNGSTGHLQKHSANLVGSLQTKVATITQKFKDILEIRTENLKKQAERREQYAGGMISGELPPQAVTGHHQGSVLLAEMIQKQQQQLEIDLLVNKNADFSIDIGSDSVNGFNQPLEGAVGGNTLYQQQLQLMEEQDAYLQSRADTMKTIESTIVELGQMFTQLATMVKEQEEIVHRIDSNVDDAEMNVEAAHTELLKYFKSISSNRWLMVKIFGILIVFFVIFVVFMA
ncbi:Syntaxin-5 [Armadillidium vulgare]|nr:Syntaxin-5 [Armadillidium vulgare]